VQEVQAGSPESELAAGIEARHALACPACGTEASLRKPLAILAQVCPAARYLSGEQLVRFTPAGSEATSLEGCNGCGAPLAVDGSSRTVACEYCGRTNLLTDAVWSRLRPISVQEVFFAVVEPAPPPVH